MYFLSHMPTKFTQACWNSRVTLITNHKTVFKILFIERDRGILRLTSDWCFKVTSEFLFDYITRARVRRRKRKEGVTRSCNVAQGSEGKMRTRGEERGRELFRPSETGGEIEWRARFSCWDHASQWLSE